MPEDVKKIIVLGFRASGVEGFYEEAQNKKLPTFGRLIQEGIWGCWVANPLSFEAQIATLLTGASSETHGITKGGDRSRAEYIWEAAQRSSKKTALFGFQVDRPPSVISSAADLSSISSFLQTSPDWDICFVWLPNPGAIQEVDRAIGEVLAMADPETLSVAMGMPAEGAGKGFIAIAGQGVKKGVLLKRKVRLEDILPTLCYLGELSVPTDCDGGILYQALEDPDVKIKELRACRRNYERLRRSSGRAAMC